MVGKFAIFLMDNVKPMDITINGIAIKGIKPIISHTFTYYLN